MTKTTEKRTLGAGRNGNASGRLSKRTESGKTTPGRGAAAGRADGKSGQNSRRRKNKAAGGGEPKRQETKLREQKRPEPKHIPAQKTNPRAGMKNRKPKERRLAVMGEPFPHNNIPVKVIPLGGIGEIGKNMTAYECNNEIIIVDCGVSFPDFDLLGVDLIIPDFTYIEKNREKVKAIFVTHGHEDHIGGIPYLLKTVNVPVYTARLTAAFIEGKLQEHGMLRDSRINVITAGQTVEVGPFRVEAIPVNHSIPDSFAFAIFTPAGVFVQTGDFKIDHTPVQGRSIDLARFGELGSSGVLALLSDSTNAERPGYTMSERRVGEALHRLVEGGEGKRIIVATFASNIHRIQEIINASVACGRKVAFSGRSMESNVDRALDLGYLDIPRGCLVDIGEANRLRDDMVTLVTTGSQGENMAALSRMAAGEHRQVKITSNDLIILSSSPIPGNEKMVSRVVNNLMKLGADVIYESMYDVHVSGHAFQNEIKMMMALTKPRFYVPVHGEYKHLRKGAMLAREMGFTDDRIVFSENGSVLTFMNGAVTAQETVPAGDVLVDGSGIGDVGSVVLRDRKRLGEDGMVSVCAAISLKTGRLAAEPEITTRGFVYVKEAEELLSSIKQVVIKAISEREPCSEKDIGVVRNKVRDSVSDLLWQRTKRSPIVLPVILEVDKP